MSVQATVTKVDLLRMGTDKKMYHLVCFKLEKGGTAISYISPQMDNFHRWKDFLKIGTVVKNLDLLKDGKTIDADSHPVLVPTLKQEELF